MRFFAFAMVLALFFLHSAVADDIVMAPEPFSHCVTCHGVELNGNQSTDSPNLSVLSAWYVEAQLIAFANQWRGQAGDEHGMEMQPMASALVAADRELVTEYVQKIDGRAATPTIEGDVDAGQALYASCAVCHGENGEGNAALSGPVLAGQSDWYLARQLQNYREGTRGTAAGDVSGAQMRAAADVLDDEADIRNVVAYINSLARP